MSNYNNRYNNNNNNGGGGNSSFYNRKRKNAEEPYAGDDDLKRQRVVDDEAPPGVSVEEELEATIFRLGDVRDPANQRQFGEAAFAVESCIEAASAVILHELTDKRTLVINTLIECASKLPEKLSIYSALLGLLNIQKPDFVEDFVDHLASSLKYSLKLGHFFIVHRLIRFVSDLVNVRVLTSKSVLNIYEKFVETINDADSPHVRIDFYVYCVLSSLPWNAKLLYDKHGPEFDAILDTIKGYIGKRQKDYLPLLKVWSSDDPHPQEEYLDCIWIQIQKLEANDWKESQIIRPYVAFETVFAASVSAPIDFPDVVPPEFNEASIFPLPRVIFRMFDYTDVPEEYILPGAHSIERFLVEEQLHSVINTYYLDRKLCANKLLQLNVTNRIPLNYMIVEIILGQLFSLPKPAHIELFFGSLLIELCKLQPNFMPQVLAQATELLFERLDTMKTTCIERFSSWFAYHLSNFQYKWSWEEWKSCLDEHAESPKNKFLRETLVRCMRLAYHQRIVEIMPESMGRLVPINPKPAYKYETEEAASLDGTAVANKLLELFKERSIPEDVFEVLRDIPDHFNEAENTHDTFNPLKIEVFTSTLLYFGSKSFSHAFAALAKYHMIFKTLVDNEAAQLVVLKSLHEIWKNHQQMMVVMVDKMLKTQIVECASVAKWIFAAEMRQELTSFYVWEILHSTISRMSKQVEKIKNEYDQMDEKYRKSSLDTEVISIEVCQEDLDQKLGTLNMLREQQKLLFFTIIRCFIEIVTNNKIKLDIKKEEPEDADMIPISKAAEPSPHENKWINERLEDILLTHNEEILPYLDDLKSQLFVATAPKQLLRTFKMFSALKK